MASFSHIWHTSVFIQWNGVCVFKLYTFIFRIDYYNFWSEIKKLSSEAFSYRFMILNSQITSNNLFNSLGPVKRDFEKDTSVLCFKIWK